MEYLDIDCKPTHQAIDDVRANAALLFHLYPLLKDTQNERKAIYEKYAPRFEKLSQKVQKWREQAEKLRPEETAQLVLNEIGLFAHYAKDEKRTGNLHEFINVIGFYDDKEQDPFAALRETVKKAAMSNDMERHIDVFNEVPILTVHQAKGLEFNTVFITAAVEDNFPNWKNKEAGQLDEELRLFYVAVTRAKNGCSSPAMSGSRETGANTRARKAGTLTAYRRN